MKTTPHSTQCIRSRLCIRHDGFTLIEILVVVAIISLLVAILLPTMAAARQSSRRVACQSNERQIATEWNVYLDQLDGFFPQKVNGHINYGGRQGKGQVWYGADPANPIEKPLNTLFNLPEVTREGAEIFKCPADTGGSLYTKTPTCFDYFGTSYFGNIVLIGQDQLLVSTDDPCKAVLEKVNVRLKKLRRAKIAGESKLPLLGDVGWIHALDRGVPVPAYPPHNGYFFDPHVRTEWHNKPYTHNIAFMDTHTEFVRIRKGMYVTDDYNVLPFDDLSSLYAKCQVERLPPP